MSQARTIDASDLTPLAAATLYAANENAHVLFFEPSLASANACWQRIV